MFGGKNNKSAKTLAAFVDDLQANGRYTFARDEAINALNASGPALKRAVMRLVDKKRLSVPRRGFYVIVPTEYREVGAPPPSWFIADLMAHLGRPYYVGLLSAGSIYGAAHQQPQEFQVLTDIPQRPMRAGRARIRFVVKKNLEITAVNERKTETGMMRVSTPEATAIDLIRYAHAAGGLNNVATVLAELAETIDSEKLVNAASADGEISVAQRLGHLLDFVGAGERAKALEDWITQVKPRNTPLKAGSPIKGRPVDRRFRVVVNYDIEVDF
jgi:predicted transcriptional regulator of viral defense system